MEPINIKPIVLKNNAYRKIIKTSVNMQIVLMSLLPNEDISLETHENHDQFLNIVSGKCLIKINDKEYKLKSGMIIIIQAGESHYVKNLSPTKKLKLYTIYSPPEHPDGLIQELKSSPYTKDNKKNQSGGADKDFVHLYQKYKTKYLNIKNHFEKIGGSEVIWRVHVSLPWYTLIKEGKKTVEGRPNRKDFAQMKVGDRIEFFNKELNENFMVEITNVTHHKSFEEMISSNGIDNVLPGIRNLDEGVQVYMQYYTKEMEAEFGVVGIHITLL